MPASKELIANLKAELATQKELAREGQRLKKQLEANETKISGLQSEITQMTTSLSESKAENKSLNMKLSASRNAEAAAAAKAVPGSAMKGSLMRPNTEAIQQATKASQMKLDLYGDLSGLIIRSVKHEGDEDVYDCIQTGRDGRSKALSTQPYLQIESLTLLRCSSPLQALHLQRSIVGELRGGRVQVPAVPRRKPRPRAH